MWAILSSDSSCYISLAFLYRSAGRDFALNLPFWMWYFGYSGALA